MMPMSIEELERLILDKLILLKNLSENPFTTPSDLLDINISLGSLIDEYYFKVKKLKGDE